MIEIDEIISNAEFCANEYKKFSEIAPERSLTFKKYEEDHRQLAEWLKDYKRLKEQELNEDWHDTPSGEMTLEQARQAVRELRKYVMDKSKDMTSRQAVKEQMIKYGFHAPDMTVTEFVEDLPSVNPQEPRTDVLDKIRAEIEEERVHDDWDFGQEIYYNNAIDDVLKIIDKYKAESEPQGGEDI